MATSYNKWINVFFAFETQVSGLLIKLSSETVEVYSKTKFLDFEATKDGFLTTLDDILGRFYQVNALEVKETVFILSQDWLVANELTPARKEILQLAKKELNLEVNGFVVLEEALIHALRQQTLSPPSLLFFTLLDKNIHLTRIELGRVSEHLSIGRSEDLLSDLAEIISRLKNNVKPLHLLLVSEKPEEVKKVLQDVNWESELGFPQQPQVDYFTFKQLIEKILLVIFKDKKRILWLEKPSLPVPDNKEQPNEASALPEDINKSFKSEKESKEGEKILAVSQDSSSFSPEAEEDLKELGVILNPDEVKAPIKAQTSSFKFPSLGLIKPAQLGLTAEKVGSLFSFSLKKLSVFSSLFLSAGSNWIIRLVLLFIPFLLVPLILVFSYLLFLKAKIVITPRREALHKTVEVTFSEEVKQADYDHLILPARVIKLNLEKKAETPTTGSKETGDPGKGKITVYNYTSKPHTFPKGTTLYLANDSNKKIKLDESVEVASKSSQKNDDGSILTIPGKAVATAETLFWGDEANLEKGMELYFTGLDKTGYSAKVTQAFQGGKKYQVKSVSQDDVDKLKEEIKNQIDQEIDQLLKDKITPGEKIINSSLKIDYLDNKLSQSVDQPAEKVSLTSKVKITVLVYKQEDVKHLIDQLVSQTAPRGFVVDKNNLSWQFHPQEGAKYQLLLEIPLKWSFDIQTIQKNLVGRDLQTAAFYLQNLPGVFAFQITFQPPVPKILQRLPYRKGNISITITQLPPKN